MSTTLVAIHLPGQEPIPAKLSTERAESSYGRPVLVLAGGGSYREAEPVAFGVGDITDHGLAAALLLDAESDPEAEALLDKAARVLQAARRERDLGNLDLAAGHAYYAMFYVAEGLLESRGLRFSKHGAVHGAYGREFARTGELDPRYHRWLLDAFRQRITAHYEVQTEFEAEAIETMIERCQEFLEAGRGYLGEG